MLQLLDKKKKLFFYLFLFILLSTQINKNSNNQNFSILKINKIEILGLSKENNLKILKSLDSILFKNIFFINKNNISEIIEKNTLIETYQIKKFYPNILKINIEETNFLAITNQENKKFYIGSNGKLISFENVKNFKKKLPFVFSKDGHKGFVNLKKIIDKSKFEFDEIDSFYYFPSNRWNIKTKDGLLIKLPEKDFLESLNLAYLIKSNPEFKNNKIIDLRMSKYIITLDE